MSVCHRMQTRKDKHVRVRLDLIEWIEQKIKEGRFWNFSHGIEYSLIVARDAEKEEEPRKPRMSENS